MEVKQIAGNMNRTKLSTNNFVTEKNMTHYHLFKAMYQSMDYQLCKQQEKANENQTNL